jgi:hypothetical protein
MKIFITSLIIVFSCNLGFSQEAENNKIPENTAIVDATDIYFSWTTAAPLTLD